MKSVAVTPAPFSFRALILIGALAAPMLLWPRMSFAYLSAPLSPAYLVCTNWSLSCFGYWAVGSSPAPFSSFIGYVHKTQIPEPSPAYLVCTRTGIGTCGGQWVVRNSPGLY